MISLPKGHKIPSVSDLKGNEYCKYHNSWNHATNDCTVLQGVLQRAIDEGILKFLEKTSDTMKVDTNPFPTITSTNVISLAKRGNRQEVETVSGEFLSSHATLEKMAELQRQLRDAQLALIDHGCCPNCKGKQKSKEDMPVEIQPKKK
ncbi:uncharacterized protein LOC132278050 [Cornus florida]|uniref:uncharacterized protein LOC132278050 n=1 Tax=Cornus florida TaxID=4283 RepID=UPI00289C103D|nr:uncharacterized protein LOC132278050 [Cornus florida]